ncbi:MAG: ABC transporter permease, partial [Acidimicrobiia bacterium]
VWQAVLSTILTLLVGLPTAWVFARFRFPGRRLLYAATLVPFVLPTLVVGTAFLNLLGPRGVIGVDISGTLGIILIAHVFYNFAVVVRGVGSYWQRIDPRLEQAAQSLGATPWRAFRTVTLPLLAPAIASTAALVFLFSFTSFGVVLLLGDLTHTTIEVEIWRQATAFLRLDVASTLAVLQIIGIGVVLVIHGHYERRLAAQFHHHTARLRRPRSGPERRSVIAILIAAGAFLFVPLAVLVGRSLNQPSGGIGLENYVNLIDLPVRSAAFIDPFVAIGNSLRFAIIAVAIATVIGLLAAAVLSYTSPRLSRSFDLFVMLPLGTSAVTIGFGFLVALDWPFDLRTSLVLIPIAHALVGIPFVVRSISPTLGSIQHRLREAAATLGATPLQTWLHVDLRLVGRAVLVGAAFAFAISMGEFGATTFIARPASPTIPIAIFRYLGRPGEAPFGAALALSSILMLVTGLSILIIDAIGSRQADEQ